jgi:hypothetical protein
MWSPVLSSTHARSGAHLNCIASNRLGDSKQTRRRAVAAKCRRECVHQAFRGCDGIATLHLKIGRAFFNDNPASGIVASFSVALPESSISSPFILTPVERHDDRKVGTAENLTLGNLSPLHTIEQDSVVRIKIERRFQAAPSRLVDRTSHDCRRWKSHENGWSARLGDEHCPAWSFETEMVPRRRYPDRGRPAPATCRRSLQITAAGK